MRLPLQFPKRLAMFLLEFLFIFFFCTFSFFYTLLDRFSRACMKTHQMPYMLMLIFLFWWLSVMFANLLWRNSRVGYVAVGTYLLQRYALMFFCYHGLSVVFYFTFLFWTSFPILLMELTLILCINKWDSTSISLLCLILVRISFFWINLMTIIKSPSVLVVYMGHRYWTDLTWQRTLFDWLEKVLNVYFKLTMRRLSDWKTLSI